MAAESGTLSSSSITVNVGDSGQITFNGYLYGVESADTNIATVTVDGESSGIITITGVSAGNTTATVSWAGRSSTITITVINNEDTSFLNKRGLAYFWNKINAKKQNKLTAGSNITINGDTISASQPAVNNGKLTIQKNGTNVTTFTANQSSNATANITVPTTVAELSDASSYVTQNNLATQLANKQNVLTAGDHINITDSTIKAVDYIHSDDPVPSSQVTQSVTNDMIATGTITADKFATGEVLKLTLSTSDIGEGSPLASNTLYGVYK